MPTQSITFTNITTHAHKSVGGVALKDPARAFPVIHIVKDPDKEHDARNAPRTPIAIAVNIDLNTLSR